MIVVIPIRMLVIIIIEIIYQPQMIHGIFTYIWVIYSMIYRANVSKYSMDHISTR